jgi:hypothetical protein
MARYLLSTHSVEGEAGPAMSDDELQQFMRRIGALEEEMRSGGAWVFSGRLEGPGTATVVRSDGGEVVVTDGPFTEAKEIIGGYALVEVASREEAMKVASDFMELHRVHWPEFEGECEVRQLEDM